MSSIIKVDTIQNQSGANIISESSNTITVGASGDTITVPSGATLTIPNGGLSGQNYPAFEAFLSTSFTPSSGVATKMTYQSEVYDTDNCYDNATNYRFTPNVAGKYYVYAKSFFISSGTNADALHTYIYKNGTAISNTRHVDLVSSDISSYTGNTSSVVNMNGTTDYLEIYIAITGTGIQMYGDSGQWSNFGAYRIGA